MKKINFYTKTMLLLPIAFLAVLFQSFNEKEKVSFVEKAHADLAGGYGGEGSLGGGEGGPGEFGSEGCQGGAEGVSCGVGAAEGGEGGK